MTQDNGMDIESPSWQELKEERDALAAHVNRLEHWIRNCNQYASILSDKPTTSLARLKDEWQVEGAVLVGALLVDKYESNFSGGEDEILQICDYALRRQAEKGGDL